MKNNSYSIRNIFLNKMGYSAIIQFFVFALILVLAKNYFQYNQSNSISENLIINDSFTLDEISRYQLLGNKYALELELFNIENVRKLDSIKFIQNLNKSEISGLGSCRLINNSNYKICKTTDGQFTGITVIEQNKNILGYIVAKKHYNSLFSMPVSYGLLLILLTVVCIFLFNFLFLFLSMRKKIENSTKYLLDFISSHQDNQEIDISKIDIKEYRKIAFKFIEEHTEITNLQKEKAYYDVRKNIAEQVAHDIRSPLAAINTAVTDVSSIPEKKRIMIRNASTRINDIANNLLSQSKYDLNQKSNSSEELNIFPELLFVVLDNIVTEKRYEYFKSQANIQFNVSNSSYNCFSNINQESFKRVLSNLINNSMEAITPDGCIIISMNNCDLNLEISISDNGCGIPQEILPKITTHGFSYAKALGAGLGLSYCKQYIEEIHGKFTIDSTIGMGTTVKIILPRCNTPQWFCESISISASSTLVVLDDDPSIHEAWKERFSYITNLEILNFYNSASMISGITKYSSRNFLFLVDYELIGNGKNGLQVIEQNKINNKSILVTSCFEDKKLRAKCELLGVKIIPKNYVPNIPILLNSGTKHLPYIFIDDDEMMRLTWSFAAEEAGKQLHTFATAEEFEKNIYQYNKQSKIYIDSNLGCNIKGEDHAKKFFELGFTELYLTTAHPANLFGHLPWIKSIVGKDPSF